MYMYTYALEVILFRRFLSLIYAELALILIIAFLSLAKCVKFTLVIRLLIVISHFVIYLIHFLYLFRSVWLRILKLVITEIIKTT